MRIKNIRVHSILNLNNFIRKQRSAVILKPLHRSGGEGITLLKPGTQIMRSFSDPVVCQRFIPEVLTDGDKRILLCNGKVVGAFCRQPKPGKFLANLHQGGRFLPASLSQRDQLIVRKVAPTLKKMGLYFVGLDVIGGYLTEINVTSPMGIREINATTGQKVEKRILDGLLKTIQQRI